jgi:Holin of 3TMs, for gene-transfer release
MGETSPKKKKTFREDWMDRKWRPAMGWMYLVVCITDFIIFPIAHATVQTIYGDVAVSGSWDPLTLKGGGLFHVAMGAVLGVAAWSRGQERITRYQQGYEDHGESIEDDCPKLDEPKKHEETGHYRYRG